MPNPQPTGSTSTEEKGWRRFSWLWIVLILLAAWFMIGRPEQGREVSYSEIKELIEADQVARVVISPEEVRAYPAEGDAPPWVAERVEGDPSLVPLLEEEGVPYDATRSSGIGSLLLAWLLPLGLLFLFWGFLARRAAGPGAPWLTAIGKSRAKVYAEEGTGVTFADVAGVDEAVQELQEIVEFLKSPERFRALGGKIPKGALLVGPPGTGKTLLARAVAGEAGVPFFSISGSEFVEMFVGVGAARVRDLFAEAQRRAPCIIFIDELDAVGKARGAGGTFGGHDEREQTLNQLLVEMDGFDARVGLIILAATNRPEVIDIALLRPGRFDRQIVVDRPDLKGREAILRIHARNVKLAPSVNLKKVAARTPGMVGADLANVMNEAALLAARRQASFVEEQDLDEAVERIIAGLERKSRRMNEKEKRIVAYHESGHALCAELLPTPDRVHKVSIIPRGVGALGFTMQSPLEDRYLMTRSELEDKIAVLLGGRVAEELTFGEVSTGAQDDLARAADLARRMVREFGMSERFGPVSFLEQNPRFPVLGGLEGEKPYGPRTAEAIDAEVEKILHQTHQRVRDLLKIHKTSLTHLAERLLAKEVVEGDELRAILKEAREEEDRAMKEASSPGLS